MDNYIITNYENLTNHSADNILHSFIMNAPLYGIA